MLRGVFWVVDGKLLAFPFREGAQLGVAKSGSVKYYAQICLQKLKNEARMNMTGGRLPSCQPKSRPGGWRQGRRSRLLVLDAGLPVCYGQQTI